MGKYLAIEDLQMAMPPTLLLEIFDDDDDGILDARSVESFIEIGEAEVNARLLGFYKMPLPDGADALLRLCALDYTIHFIYERHQEAVSRYADQGAASRYERAEKRMALIQSGIKRLPDNSPAAGPKNLGGIIYDTGPKTIVDSATGAYNGGDF